MVNCARALGTAARFCTTVRPTLNYQTVSPTCNHIEIEKMMSRSISVPNSLLIHNMRQILLKSRSQPSSLLEKIENLLLTTTTRGILRCMSGISPRRVTRPEIPQS